MSWPILALFAAVANATKPLFVKKANGVGIDVWTISCSIAMLAVPFLLIATLLLEGMPDLFGLPGRFWWAVTLTGIGNAVAIVFQTKAYTSADISIVGPTEAMGPMYLLFTTNWINGETAGVTGWVGVGIVVLGVYVLKLSSLSVAPVLSPAAGVIARAKHTWRSRTFVIDTPQGEERVVVPRYRRLAAKFRRGTALTEGELLTHARPGFLAPFRSIFFEPATLLIVGASLIWGFTGAFDKAAIVASNAPVFSALILNLLIGLFLLVPVFLWGNHTSGRAMFAWSRQRWLLIIGGLTAIMFVFQFIAVGIAPNVAFVSAIKQTGAVLTVLWGVLILKEKDWQRRIPGVVIIVAGAILIARPETYEALWRLIF